MSKNRKNFHYHYAEQYETRAERCARARARSRYSVSPVTLVITVVLLLMFGLISTTFSVYVTGSNDKTAVVTEGAYGGLAVQVKNKPVRSDLHSTGLATDVSLTGAVSNLANTGADVDLSATSAGNLTASSDILIYLDTSSFTSWTDSSATFKLNVEKLDNTWFKVNASAVSTNLYAATLPAGSYYTLQWLRFSSDGNTQWNYGKPIYSPKNYFIVSGYDNSGDWYNYALTGRTYYLDTSRASAWNTGTPGVAGSVNDNGLSSTKIADNLYRYIMPSDWADKENLYWVRGTTWSWGQHPSFSVPDEYFGGKNLFYLDNAEYAATGTQTSISLDSLTTPEISGSTTADGTTTTFKGNAAYTITVDNNASIVLNYTRGSDSVTTGLIDKSYTYTLLDSSDNVVWSSNSTNIIPANTIDGSTHAYGNYKVKVTVSSALTGKSADSAELPVEIKNPNACVLHVDSAATQNYSLNVNETRTVTVNTAFHTDGANTVTVSSGDSTIALVSADGTSYSDTATITTTSTGTNVGSGTVYIKALKPTTVNDVNTPVEITASCAVSAGDEDDESTEATVNLTVTTPTVDDSAISLAVDASGSGAVTPAYNSTDITGITSITYTSGNASYYTVDSSTGAISAIAPGTADLSIAVVYNSSYSVTYTRSVTVTPPVVDEHVASSGYTLMYDSSITFEEVTSTPSASSVTYALTTTNNGTDTPATTASITGTRTITVSNNSNNVSNIYLKYTLAYTNGHSVSGYIPVHITARPACNLSGLGKGWGHTGAGLNMTYNGNNEYSCQIWLNAGYTYGKTSPYNDSDTYGFKIRYDSTYYSGADTLDNGHYCVKSAYNSPTMVTGYNNMYIETTLTEFYTFTFNSSTMVLTVTYPTNTLKYYVLGLGEHESSWLDQLSDPTFASARRMTLNSGAYTWTYNATTGGAKYEGSDSSDETVAGDGFKIYCNDGTYYGLDNTTIDHANCPTTAATGFTLTTSGANVGFHVWYTGNYTFKFVTGTSKIYLSAMPSRSVRVLTYINSTNQTAYMIDTGALNNSGNAENNYTVTKDYLSVRNNWDNTFTIFTTRSFGRDSDPYKFSNWSYPSSTPHTETNSGVDSYGGISYQTVVTVSTSTIVRGYFVNNSYDVIYHTYGPKLGSTYGTVNDGGDTTPISYLNRTYTDSHVYNSARTLPKANSFLLTGTGSQACWADWVFGGWYENEDFTGSPVTSIGATEVGAKEYWAKWTVKVYFTDNVNSCTSSGTGGRVSKNETVIIGGDATPPVKSVVNPDLYTGFTLMDIVIDDVAYPDSVEWAGEYNDVYENKVVKAIYHPVTETVTIGFTPNERADRVADTLEWNLDFGASIEANFVVDSAYTSDPGTRIVYQYATYNGSSWSGWTDFAEGSDPDTTDGRKWIYTDENIVTHMTLTGNTLQLKFRTYFDDTRGQRVYTLAQQTYLVTYNVNTPLQSFNFDPYQKIYASSSFTGETPAAKLNADFVSYTTDIADITKYRTTLFSFDQHTGTEIDMGVNAISEAEDFDAEDNPAYYSDMAALINNTADAYANITDDGVKYYRMRFERYDSTSSSFVYNNSLDLTDWVHTTVGTTQLSGSRPLFLKSGSDYTAYNVMAFYIQDSVMKYQTAECYTRTGQSSEWIYRFNIPTDVTQVVFALMNPENKYLLPSVNTTTGVFTFSGNYCYAFTSTPVTVTDIQTVYISSVTGSAAALNTLNCSTGTPRLG